MAYYDALVSAWNSGTLPSGVTGTPLTQTMTVDEKLSAINGWTVAGPTKDVPASAVIAYLALNAKLVSLTKYAQTTPLTAGVVSASELVALFGMGSNTPMFGTSNPTVYATVSGMLAAIASDANSGLTSADVSNLLALAATTVPWWQSVGYTSPISASDLDAAGGLS